MLNQVRHWPGDSSPTLTDGPANTNANTSATPCPGAPVKVLAVDDNDDNLFVLEALLGRHGVEVLLAHSADEALELLLVHDVALALLDVQMPDMDGYELARCMRDNARTRQIPIVFTTAGATDRSAEFRADDAGPVEFLCKPLDGDVVRATTDRFVQRYRQRDSIPRSRRTKEAAADDTRPASRRAPYLPW